MPRINRYFQPKPFEGQLYTPPLEIIGKAMEISQQRHDINSELAEKMKNQYIPSLPQDRKRAKELEDAYNKKIDDVVAKYHGDLSQATNELNKLRYDIKKDFSPNGEAGAIINNYNNYTAWLKNSQELVEKGKALGEDFNLAHNYEMKRYQGIGQRNPTTGSFNNFNPETLTEYVNPDTIIQDVYKNFKPEKQRLTRTVFEGNKRSEITEEYEGIEASRLFPSFSTALKENPKYITYLLQKARHMGLPPEQYDTLIDQYAASRAQDLSYMNKTLEENSDYDKAYLIRLRQRLKDESDKSLLESLYQYEPSVSIRGEEPSNIDPNNWRNSGDPSWKVVNNPMLHTLPYGGMSGFNVDPVQMSNIKGKYDDKNLKQALEDPKFVESTKIFKPLMDEVFNRNAGASPDFKKKYGKDPVWTDNFDKQVVKEFKEREASHSRTMGVRSPISDPDARQEMLRRIAGELEVPESVRVMEVGKLTWKRGDEVGLKASDIVKDGKLQTDYLAYAQPGGSHGAAGYIIRKGGKEYILVDTEIEAHNASTETIAALSPIMTGKSKLGGGIMKVAALPDGRDAYGIPELMFDKDYNEFYRFHLVDPETKKPTGSVADFSIADFYEKQKTRYRKALGVGGSKRSKMFFPYNTYEQIED